MRAHRDRQSGRCEARRLWALPVLSDEIGFFWARQIARIERLREDMKTGKRSEEISLPLASLLLISKNNAPLDAPHLPEKTACQTNRVLLSCPVVT
ncbi:MAG: hypothetical protein QME60_04275 [Verrucomicrobiota bacterium]|nr:hypothetical protein [Verrucomicrobiota bacterium]